MIHISLTMRLVSWLALTLTFLCCQSPQKINSDLSEAFECTWNESRTFQLCLTQSEKEQFPTPITYELFDKGGRLIKNGKIRSGYVKWLSDTAIELFETPGILPEGIEREDLVKVYQISNGQFISMKEYLKLKEE